MLARFSQVRALALRAQEPYFDFLDPLGHDFLTSRGFYWESARFDFLGNDLQASFVYRSDLHRGAGNSRCALNIRASSSQLADIKRFADHCLARCFKRLGKCIRLLPMDWRHCRGVTPNTVFECIAVRARERLHDAGPPQAASSPTFSGGSQLTDVVKFCQVIRHCRLPHRIGYHLCLEIETSRSANG